MTVENVEMPVATMRPVSKETAIEIVKEINDSRTIKSKVESIDEDYEAWRLAFVPSA